MIRQATQDDFPAIEAMCAEFWSHSAFPEPYRAHSGEFYLNIALSQGLLLVAEQDDEIIGFCAGCMAQLMGDSEIISGTELAWWVSPQYRGGTHGVKMLKQMEQLAKDAGCTYWNMVYMESSMPETVRSMYQRMGYELVETTYSKRIA